jgi:hypothetical protein
MVAIPENVKKLMAAQGTVKVLVTSEKGGQPHAIVCGSIFQISDSVIGVGEVLMKKSAANLAANKKAEILIVAGMESYGIEVEACKRYTEGKELEALNQKLAAIHLKAGALQAFQVVAVYNESANPNAGKKIA